MPSELKTLFDREASLRDDESMTLAKQVDLVRHRADVLGTLADTKERQAKLTEAGGEASRLHFEAQHSKDEQRILLHEARTLETERARVRTQADTARYKATASANDGMELDATPVGAGRAQRTRPGAPRVRRPIRRAAKRRNVK